MEQTHGLLYAIMTLHKPSDTNVELPPDVLHHVGRFTEYILPIGFKSLLSSRPQNTPQDVCFC